MPNSPERAISTVVVDPDIAVRPAVTLRGMLSASTKTLGYR